MKLVVFSDLHIAHKMIDEAVIDNLFLDITNNVTKDTIICFCGDLMHKRVDLNDVYAQQAVLLFRKIDSLEVPVIVIEGTFSHDYRYIDTFKKIGLKNFTFIQELTELKDFKNNIGESLNILCIPEDYVEDQHEYYKNTVYNKKKVYDLVLMHGTFTDVLFHNVNIEADILRKAPKFDSKDFSRHILTLSGHIHKHQVLGKNKNVIYVGSYSNMNFGEDKNNTLMVVDFDKDNKNFSFKLIENTQSHKFIELELDENMTYDEFIEKYLNDIRNKSERTHYKIFYNGTDAHLIDLLKNLKKEMYVKSISLNKKTKEKETKVDEEQTNYTNTYSGPIEQQIQTYAKNVLNKDISIEKINEILRKE